MKRFVLSIVLIISISGSSHLWAQQGGGGGAGGGGAAGGGGTPPSGGGTGTGTGTTPGGGTSTGSGPGTGTGTDPGTGTTGTGTTGTGTTGTGTTGTGTTGTGTTGTGTTGTGTTGTGTTGTGTGTTTGTGTGISIGLGTGSGTGTTASTPTYFATYKLDGGASTQAGPTYNATATDTSAVWVTNSGKLLITNATLTTTGSTSSQDNSSFYGQDGALVVTAAGSATINGGSISTTGTGANGAVATGSGSSVTLSAVSIKTTGDGAHAALATQGGVMTLTNPTLTTAGSSASAIATDRGAGTITVTGGTVTTSGANSAGLYSTGALNISGTSFTVKGAECAVVEGASSITLTNATLNCGNQKWGAMIYQSQSGDSSATQGFYTMTGGAFHYAPTTGPLFYITNTTAVITLKGVAATTGSGTFLQAAAGNWGNATSNGGNAQLTADGQTITGDFLADGASTLTLVLKNSSSLSGAINHPNTGKSVAVTLDSTSSWTLTDNSYVASLSGATVASSNSISNISGNGNNIYYDATQSANAYLSGKTYSLVGGGSLIPSGSTVTSLPSINTGGITNGASQVPGIAPGTAITIYGSNLATSTATVGATDLIGGYLPTSFAGATVTVNGKSAYFTYASPTQLNLETPAGTTAGSVTVTVTTLAGSTSMAVDEETVMPGLYTSSNSVVAYRPADSATITGTGTVVAHPGDVLEIFATGLGATSPSVAPGLVSFAASTTTSKPNLTIGGSPVPVQYSGLIAPGVYQINFTVPASLSAGTYSIVVTQGGVQSQSTAQLRIATN